MGMGTFPKDESLQPIPHVSANINELSEALTNKDIVGLDPSDISRLIDITDNTKIKEELALAAEQAKEALIIYCSGYVISRKGHLYLASSGSSRSKIHLNGISFDEIMSILEEAGAPSKILLLDVCFLDSEEEEEVDIEAALESLKAYDQNNERLFVISTAPSMNTAAFFGYKETTIFTQALLEVLHEGTPVEANMLSLSDICRGIDRYLEGMGVHQPCFCSPAVEGKEVVFAHNIRYAAYQILQKEADGFFEQQAYQEALEAYKKATKLLPGNQEVEQKRKFILLLLQGIAASDNNEYDRAKEAFVQAHELMPIPIVKEKIIATYTSIANQKFAVEQYEDAKSAYKQVLTWDDANTYAKEKYEDCQRELQFLDWMEEADRFYFDDQFKQAFDFYGKALALHNDRKAQHRKNECERLIQKEEQLREQLVAELSEEMNQEASKVNKEVQEKKQQDLEQEIEERLRASLTESLTDELRPTIESMLRPKLLEEVRAKAKEELMREIKEEVLKEAKAEIAKDANASKEEKKAWHKKAKDEFEEEFWTHTLLINQIEVYRFYLQFFPRPKYTEKAKNRIEDLRKQAEVTLSEALPTAPVKNETSVPTEEPTKETSTGKDNTDETVAETTKEAPAQEAHKKEEPGDKDAQHILEELEAQFNGEAKEKAKNDKPKDAAPSDAIAEGMFKAIQETAKKSEKKPEPEKEPEKEYSEEQLWEQATKAHSLEGYRFYVDKTKDSAHLVDAYYQINQLSKKEKGEEGNQPTPTTKADVPVNSNGKHTGGSTYSYSVNVKSTEKEPKTEVFEVQESEKEPSMKEDALWKQACTLNTVKGYYEYISQSKEKRYLTEAKAKIQDIKANAKESEAVDWEEAQSMNTIEAFKGYIRKYPLGDYYAKAMYKISELEANK